MKRTMKFAEGFLLGSMVGGVICLMMEPPNTAQIKKAYKKTNRALKTVGYAIEDLVMSR